MLQVRRERPGQLDTFSCGDDACEGEVKLSLATGHCLDRGWHARRKLSLGLHLVGDPELLEYTGETRRSLTLRHICHRVRIKKHLLEFRGGADVRLDGARAHRNTHADPH